MSRELLKCGAAILFAVTLTGAALADDESSGGGLTGLVVEGFANPAPTADPCILINTEVATVLLVDIGRVDWQSEETVDLSSSADCLGPEGAEIEGMFVITAENGDQIFGVYQTVAKIDLGSAKITALGHYRITGGSGSFYGRRGLGIIKAFGDFLPPFGVTGELIAQPAFDDD